MNIPDQVFPMRIGNEIVWKVIISGKIVSADWLDKGSALAGLQVEKRRQMRRTTRERTLP